MKKPETPENEKERLESLAQYNILDTLPEQAFDDITAIAAQICGTPIALVSLIDEKRQWFKSHHGLAVSETPRELAYCAHAINEPQKLMEVKDATLDNRFQDNPLLTGDPHVRYYAGSPLVNEEGHALGTLCVIDHQPRTLSVDQKQSLEALSRQVVRLLEARKLEKDLKLTQYSVEHSPAGIAWISEEGMIIKFNHRFVELTGYDIAGIDNKRIFEFDPNFNEINWRTLWSEIQIKKSVTIDSHFIRQDKSVRWVEFNLKFLDFENKKYVHAVCIDITDSINAKQREKEILVGLKELLREKDDLIGLFSHDMKSPINQVKGLGQIMALSLDDKEALKESLVKLDQTANRQLNLYKNILVMLRSDQLGDHQSSTKNLSLLSILTKVVKGLDWETNAKNIQIQLSIPKPIIVHVQLNLFTQAMQNILSNAIKFSYEGGLIEVRAQDTNLNVIITVKDHGMGFDQSKEAALFERFTKEGRKGTQNEVSTGLGLYLVKKIIENHGGSISAKSDGVDKGATFIVTLPSS